MKSNGDFGETSQFEHGFHGTDGRALSAGEHKKVLKTADYELQLVKKESTNKVKDLGLKDSF